MAESIEGIWKLQSSRRGARMIELVGHGGNEVMLLYGF